ncbi:hypothetical protein BDK51DRAFT_49174 [Blyttiomyces helicus]|uniref:Uncharacterized protein n=1 Tax=Blyttiomyces helicus TaxID=388810 RepID=A0A4P9VYH4_9FUNG|nr:hypothetical protein BDK51DRAFT_49174 [Blyttiomyces helicus]|eukprot:RKO84322.1 hypothetical protein BDK51DRAFT_49174 [Blyttiomyces helicus]
MKFLFASTLAVLLSSASAAPVLSPRRFGQEQAVDLGDKLNAAGPHCQNFAGVAGTLGGQSAGTIVARADPCAKLRLADQIVAAAKAHQCDAQGTKIMLDAAMDEVHAEHNFSPFAGALDIVCLDASLPVSPELRGIPPLVDPRNNGPGGSGGLAHVPAGADAASTKVNAATTAILAKAKAAGKGPGSTKSVAQQLVDLGFNFIQGLNSTTPSASSTTKTTTTIVNAPSTPTAATTTSTTKKGKTTTTVTVTVTVTRSQCAATAAPSSATAATSNAGTSASVIFSPAPVLGIQGVPLVRSSDPKRRFQVAQDTFVGQGAACQRVGDKLFNQCANALNGGKVAGKNGSSIGSICDPARTAATSGCLAAVKAAGL